jgi:GDP-mannose 6-dehydrogenase
MEMPEKQARVAVFGLGYVGCVTAACLADLGHSIVGVDRDEHKVRSVLEGRAPFFEPHLEELIQKNLAAGRLSATVSAAEGLRNAEIALICVGTPSEKNGNLDLGQLRRVVEEIAQCVASRSQALTVAIRSTVFPGVCEEVVIPAFAGLKTRISVVSNPEFLREGVAIRDFVEPSLLVVGGKDADSVAHVASLYAGLDVRPSLVSLRTAEMIKYACNAFHALKVAFANEIGALSGKLDIDGREVMDTLCRDERLNISAAYLTPGFAFGGSCLPKDLRALNYRASRLDLELPLLASTLPSNQEHLERSIQAALELSGKLGVIGLAFKENTDDLRESPVVGLLERLIGKGRQVRVWDAHIQLDSIYGANRDFILRTIPHISRVLDKSLEEILGWAEHLVITQKQRPEIMERIQNSGLPGLDLASGVQLAGNVPAADYT